MEPGFKEGYKVVRRVGSTDRGGFKPATLDALQSVRYHVGMGTHQDDYANAGPFAVFDSFNSANRFASDLILWCMGPNPHYAILRIDYLPSSNKKLWRIAPTNRMIGGLGMKIVGRLIVKLSHFPRGTKFARAVIPREVLEVKEDV